MDQDIQKIISEFQGTNSQDSAENGDVNSIISEFQNGSQTTDSGSQTPADINFAEQNLGSHKYPNLCQQFVEQATGSGIHYGSAAQAWNSQLDKAKAGIDGAKPGDLVYFSGGRYGHTGIYMGNNKFISATDYGVVPFDINDWEKKTGQKMAGYLSQ